MEKLILKLQNLVDGLNETERTEKFADKEYTQLVEEIVQKFKAEGHGIKEIYKFINFVTNNYDPTYHQDISLDALMENDIDSYGGDAHLDVERNELIEIFNTRVKTLSKTQLVYHDLFCLGYTVREVSEKLNKPVKTVYKMRISLCKIFKEFKCYLLENKENEHGEVELPNKFRFENKRIKRVISPNLGTSITK